MSRRDGQSASAYYDHGFNSWTVAYYMAGENFAASKVPCLTEKEAREIADRFNQGKRR